MLDHALRDIYCAENQILKALLEMVEKVNDPKLKQGFEKHLRETENQVKRLEEVFRLHNADIKGIDCPAIDGILEEAQNTAGEADNRNVLDAALIFSAQAVEHYEITRYGSLISWTKLLGRPECAELLQQNLAEEVAADKAASTNAPRRDAGMFWRQRGRRAARAPFCATPSPTQCFMRPAPACASFQSAWSSFSRPERSTWSHGAPSLR